MPSRASNAVLTVDSREARDIGISLERFCWAGGRLCRNLRRESQEHTLVMDGPDPAIHVFPHEGRKMWMAGGSPGMRGNNSRGSSHSPTTPPRRGWHARHG